MDVEENGACYGFRIRSSSPLRLTRTDPPLDWPVLEVVEGDLGPVPTGAPVLSWSAADAPVSAQVHLDGEGSYRVHVDGGGWFGVRTAPDGARVTIPPGAEPVRREERLWGLPAMLCLLQRGDVPLHAAALEIEGRAVLIAGPSRAGKTTLAAAAVSAGLRLLSEDLSCIRPGSPPLVFPGPAHLRVRRDVAGEMDLPPSRATDLGDDRLHLAVEDRSRAGAAPLELSAVVLLREGASIGLTTADPATALRDLWSLSFRLPDTRSRTRCFGELARLVDAVPIMDLRRPLTLSALPESLDALRSVAHG